jgi:DNA-binding transcriptional MerR regulator
MAASTKPPRRTVMLAVRRAPRGTPLIEVEVLARETGLHPDVVRRLVRLGLVERAGGTAQEPLFRRDAASRLARALRLRRDLGLNYAGAALASDLLARIDELEERMRRGGRSR